jgi:hypothetical protein
MHHSLYTATHNDWTMRDSDEACLQQWQLHLPKAWRTMVDVPLYFQRFREHELPASRTVGLDENDVTCYCAHSVVIPELRSDDDEEFYHVVTYAEQLAAWRLRDGRWLIFRRVGGADCAAPLKDFYSFSDAMPR